MDFLTSEDESSSEEDGKPYAVPTKKANPKSKVGEKKKATIAEASSAHESDESTEVEIMSIEDAIISSYKETVQTNSVEAQNYVTNGMVRYMYEPIGKYKEQMKGITFPELFAEVENSDGLGNVKANCLTNSVSRRGLMEMSSACGVMVDLFCVVELEMFGGATLGITRLIQQVFSK